MREWEAAAVAGHRRDPSRSGTVRFSVAQPGTACPYKGPRGVPTRGRGAVLRPRGADRQARQPAPVGVDARHRWAVGQWKVVAPAGRADPGDRSEAHCRAARAGRCCCSPPGVTRSASWSRLWVTSASESERVPSLDQLQADPRSVRPIATSGTGALIAHRPVRGAVHPQFRRRRGCLRRGARRVGGAGREPGADRDLASRRLLRRVRPPCVAGSVHQRQPGAGRADATSGAPQRHREAGAARRAPPRGRPGRRDPRRRRRRRIACR